MSVSGERLDRSSGAVPEAARSAERAAVEAEGITFAVTNGISTESLPLADLSETMQSLGYHPVDDAWADR